MYLYKLNYSFVPFSDITYFYQKKKKGLTFFFRVLQNHYLVLHMLLNCFLFIFKNCFFVNLLVNTPWKLSISSVLMKSYTKWFQVFKKGEYCRNRTRLEISGLGIRIIEDTWKTSQYLFLKLGHAHLIFFYKTGLMKFKKYKRKHVSTIFSTNRFLLANFVYLLRRFRGPNCYTGNGVKFFREKLKYKPRKKWGVF